MENILLLIVLISGWIIWRTIGVTVRKAAAKIPPPPPAPTTIMKTPMSVRIMEAEDKEQIIKQLSEEMKQNIPKLDADAQRRAQQKLKGREDSTPIRLLDYGKMDYRILNWLDDEVIDEATACELLRTRGHNIQQSQIQELGRLTRNDRYGLTTI